MEGLKAFHQRREDVVVRRQLRAYENSGMNFEVPAREEWQQRKDRINTFDESLSQRGIYDLVAVFEEQRATSDTRSYRRSFQSGRFANTYGYRIVFQ